MRVPPPKHLPPLRSTKWHGRKLTHPLEYLRVQHMACDRSSADLEHILKWLKNGDSSPINRQLLDLDQRAVVEARKQLALLVTMRKLASETEADFEARLDQIWVGALGVLDGYLEQAHRQFKDHMNSPGDRDEE